MKLLFVSLGCDKNLVDSEEMLGLLTGNGFEIVDDETEAEAIVVNTCCFINDAKEESVNTILEMAEYKKSGTCKALIVTGCMAQRYKEEITQEIPEVDAVLGTTSYGDIVKALNEVQAGKPAPDLYRLAMKRGGLKPSEVIAFEDSLSGVKAARAAGLRTVYVPQPGFRDLEPDVNYYRKIGDLAEGMAILRALP